MTFSFHSGNPGRGRHGDRFPCTRPTLDVTRSETFRWCERAGDVCSARPFGELGARPSRFQVDARPPWQPDLPEGATPGPTRRAGLASAESAKPCRSLGVAQAALFLFSWLAQSIAGAAAYNEQQLRHLQAPTDRQH
ncbi:DUF6766 family protein [Streptomyces sp. NPDC102487]|uniref:DUF6766 family protein n=1 Tax=Streptomyces sp. NPDC102487 TaxID=3366182 RepID=UPI0037FFA83E